MRPGSGSCSGRSRGVAKWEPGAAFDRNQDIPSTKRNCKDIGSADQVFLCVLCVTPAIPGCVSQGATREEALANVREAIAACLEVRAERGLPLTVETQQVEVAV